MNTKRLLVALCFIAVTLTSKSQAWNWAQKLNSPANSGLLGIATIIDVAGNYVVLSGVDSSLSTDGTPSLNRQFNISKYDNQGTLLWIKNFSHNNTLWSYNMVTDSAGSIYVLTSRYSAIEGVTYNGPNAPTYLTKLSAFGDWQWVKSMGSLSDFNTKSLKCDGKNIYLYASPAYITSFPFLDTTYTAPAPSGIPYYSFVAKLDSSGTRKWQKLLIDTLGLHFMLGMDINRKKELVFSGSFQKKIWINGVSMSNTPGSSAYADYYAVLNTDNGQNISVFGPVLRDNFNTAICINDSSEVIVPMSSPDTIFRAWTIPSGTHVIRYLPGTYLMAFRNNGNFKSVKRLSPSVLDLVYDIESDTANNVYASMKLFFNSGTFNDSAFLAVAKYNIIYDTSQSSVWQANVGGSYYQGGNHYYAYMPSLDVRNGEIAVTGGFRLTGNFGPYSVAAGSITKGYIASLKDKSCTITGKVFIDANNNGQFDSGEQPVSNVAVTTQTNYFDFTDAGGNYKIYADTGNYTAQLQASVPYYNSVPPTYTGNFSAYGQTATNKNFALQSVGPVNDLEVDVTPMTPARPGRVLTYLMTVKNKGTTTLTNKYSLKLGSFLTYASSDSTATVNGDSITWNYTSFKPYEIRTNHVNVNVATTAPMSTVIKSTGYVFPIAGDSIPVNNVDTAYSIVTAGYDPNDKLVFPGNQVHIDSVQQGKLFFEYIIRFQNTGNDTAFQVRVIDSMTTKLNPATFELISSSHPVEVNRRGQRTVEFNFPNIQLPDSTRNEPKSHGFVKFRVKPVTSVVLTDSVYNFADIYFDYNAAVRTNTIATGFRNTVVTGINDPTLNTTDLKIYPNPASVQLIYKLEKSPRETMMARVYDITGRIIVSREIKGNGNALTGQIGINGLPVGVYQLEIISSKMRYVREFLVK